MVVEGLVDVGVGGFGDAVSADLDSGFEAVGLFLEGAYLSGCEWVHGGSVFLRFLNWFLFAGVVWVAVEIFFISWGWLFGVVFWVCWLFGGFFGFVWVLFCYWIATGWLLFCLVVGSPCACGAFAGAGGACDDAVGGGEVFPAVLAYHDPAEGFVGGAEGAGVWASVAA